VCRFGASVRVCLSICMRHSVSESESGSRCQSVRAYECILVRISACARKRACKREGEGGGGAADRMLNGVWRLIWRAMDAAAG
jgi:hypothetical protein